MLAILLHGMQGTPYIYQGEELGMTNAAYAIEDYRDIETRNMYRERLERGYDKKEIMASIHAKGRDNARTPMQWDDSENAGFTTGIPWIRINPNYREIHAVSQVNDPESIFSCYQKLIRLRKNYDVFVDGTFHMVLEEDQDFFAYQRENNRSKLLVICNFFGHTRTYPLKTDWKDMELLIGNYASVEQPEIFRPHEARMYVLRKENS